MGMYRSVARDGRPLRVWHIHVPSQAAQPLPRAMWTTLAMCPDQLGACCRACWHARQRADGGPPRWAPGRPPRGLAARRAVRRRGASGGPLPVRAAARGARGRVRGGAGRGAANRGSTQPARRFRAVVCSSASGGRAGARTAARALPDVSLALASLEATPAVVSMGFNVVTFLPQWLWLLMVFLPNWDVTKKIMQPLWPVILFGCVHLFIVYNVASTNPDNVEELTTLIQVFNPEVQGKLLSDFSPQENMMKLMKSPGFVSEEWSHVLVWDLFVGRWIYLDGQRRGIFTSHSVLFCNLIGPPGLLLHAATCLLLGRGLPDEEERPRGA
ncbi:unnamed protein product [Prorocentrum cordatum]|uniref:Alpha-1,3-glucosyltransferase n=1 Tax=Prorocentrum cordatum TaxID=2364126 RepID=A0ABN9PEH8_9DINO|nr:unnamed protein product [Polarella glacialis]